MGPRRKARAEAFETPPPDGLGSLASMARTQSPISRVHPVAPGHDTARDVVVQAKARGMLSRARTTCTACGASSVGARLAPREPARRPPPAKAPAKTPHKASVSPTPARRARRRGWLRVPSTRRAPQPAASLAAGRPPPRRRRRDRPGPRGRDLSWASVLAYAVRRGDDVSRPGGDALLAEWAGPFGGVPPFGRFSVDDLAPALEAAMATRLAEIDAIASNTAAPSFENTIAALERAGRALDRVGAVLGRPSTSTLNDETVQSIERAMAPKLAAHADAVVQEGAALFARIASVYEARDRLGLTPEQQRLVWLHFTTFAHAGARLDDASLEGARSLAALNQRLAELDDTHVRAEPARRASRGAPRPPRDRRRGRAPRGSRPRSVDGALSRGLKSAGHPERWAVLNTRSSVEPFLTYSTRDGTCARGSGTCSSRGATGRLARQRRDHRRHPPRAPGLRAGASSSGHPRTPALAPRGHDARRRPSGQWRS